MLDAEDARTARNFRIRLAASKALDVFFIEATTALGGIIPGAPIRPLIRRAATAAAPRIPVSTELELPSDIMAGGG